MGITPKQGDLVRSGWLGPKLEVNTRRYNLSLTGVVALKVGATPKNTFDMGFGVDIDHVGFWMGVGEIAMGNNRDRTALKVPYYMQHNVLYTIRLTIGV